MCIFGLAQRKKGPPRWLCPAPGIMRPLPFRGWIAIFTGYSLQSLLSIMFSTHYSTLLFSLLPPLTGESVAMLAQVVKRGAGARAPDGIPLESRANSKDFP